MNRKKLPNSTLASMTAIRVDVLSKWLSPSEGVRIFV